MKTTVNTEKVWHNILWTAVAISICASFLMHPGTYRKTIIDEVNHNIASFKADEEQSRIDFRKSLMNEFYKKIMPSALIGGKTK